MSDTRTDLPSVKAPNFEQRVREVLMTYLGRQGNPLDRGLTLRDLISAGILKLRDGVTLRPGGPPPIEPGPAVGGAVDGAVDLTPPPQPTGFRATGAITHILVEHDEPTYPMGGGHLRTHVYGVQVNQGDPLPTFGDAVELYQFSGVIGAVPSNPATTWRLWIKWESKAGVLSVSPAGGTNGLEVRTGEDVALLIEALTGNNPPQPFIFVPAPTVVNGVNVPPGTYIKDGFIQNGTITNAKIANAAIDDAKIANLSASKITAGSVAVGQHIQSTGYVAGSAGWRINGDGNAELSNATVRGTVFANNGQFHGTLLGGSATTYANGLGFYSGWSGASTDANYRWRVGSPTGARIQWTGSAVEVYNASNQLTLSSGGVDWAAVTNKPAFGIFATAAQLTSSNIGTYIANAAIGTAQIADASITSAKIASIALVGTSNFSVKTATTGARMEMDSRAIKVFDARGVLRVQLGDLTV